MSYQDALTTAREQMLLARKELDELIASLDRMLGVKRTSPLTETATSNGASYRATKTKVYPDTKAPKKPAGGKQPAATPPDRVERIRGMYEAGESPDAIGKKVGVSGQTVRNLAKRFSWKKPVAIKKLPRGVSGRPDQ